MDGVFRALADPSRRKILTMLKAGPLQAGEIAGCFPYSAPTMSNHLKVLKAADLVVTQRQGTSIIYHLNASVLEEALLAVIDGLPRQNQQKQEQHDGPNFSTKQSHT